MHEFIAVNIFNCSLEKSFRFSSVFSFFSFLFLVKMKGDWLSLDHERSDSINLISQVIVRRFVSIDAIVCLFSLAFSNVFAHLSMHPLRTQPRTFFFFEQHFTLFDRHLFETCTVCCAKSKKLFRGPTSSASSVVKINNANAA